MGRWEYEKMRKGEDRKEKNEKEEVAKEIENKRM